MANFLHGVETIEVERGARPIRVVKTAVIGLVGTAPIHEVEAGNQKINEPVLITNEKAAAAFFGKDRPGFTIPSALKAIFDQGAGTVIVINTLDPAEHKTNVTNATKTFVDGKIALNHYGITLPVVKSSDESTTYVLDTHYTVDTKEGIITVKGSTIAADASVKVSYTHVDPEKVLSSDIIGDIEDGKRTGLKALEDAYSLFGYYAKTIIAPVFCVDTAVVAAIDVVAGKTRAIGIVDAPQGTTFQEAITGRGAEGDINFNTSSDRLILCFPHLKKYDNTTNNVVSEPYSQRLAGVIAAKDNTKGYWWSPSNTEIKGITGVETPLTAMINDPTSEVNQLNEAGIMTIFNSFGTGFRTWGNRSAAFPSSTHPTNFINVRRTADIIHESVEYSMLQFIDHPIDKGLIDAITESVNAFMRVLIGRGAIIDGKCSFDPAKNEPVQIAAGHLTFDIEFMPPTPAERITFESFINIELLRTLLGGN